MVTQNELMEQKFDHWIKILAADFLRVTILIRKNRFDKELMLEMSASKSQLLKTFIIYLLIYP